MINSFNDLGISPQILKAIEEMGFETPTEVQGKAIPHILKQEDLIVKSKTGSGKTAVFGISMLQMTDPGNPGPQGLILTPTRELAVQVDSDLKKMAKHLQHRTTAVYGQHSMNTEIQALNKGASIVTGTPGRVFDHISHGNLTTKNIRFLVLDEADRMLDMGFIDQVEKIIKTLPKDRVTLLFSATIPSEIRKICRDYMKNPVTIEIESQTMTVDTVEQKYYRVERNEKRTQLLRLLLVEQPESCMIFCNTRIAVDQVQSFLTRKGYASEALHGDIPQAKRLKTMQRFKEDEFHLLVATDVAARGIHIEGLSLVINYDVPVEKDSYVHRIGRTGRAGKGGRAVSLVTGDDIMTLYEIEEHIGALIEEGELPSDAVLAEKKAGAELWKEANAVKARPVNAADEAAAAQARRKPPQRSRQREGYSDRRPTVGVQEMEVSRPKPPQRRPVQTASRPIEPQPGNRMPDSRQNPARQKSEQPRPIRQERPFREARPVQQTRPFRQASKPVSPVPGAEASKASFRKDTGIVQDQAPAAGKSFIRRVLDRIFGRKEQL